MRPEALFGICNPLALAGWILLLVAPYWRWTPRVSGIVIPLALSAIYFALILAYFPGSPGGFDSLAAVRELFTNDWLLLAGWVHYLAFDLFIGAWEAREAARIGMRHWLLVPCLLLTFLLGPIGLLLFLALRGATGRRIWIDEKAAAREPAATL